jgi:hypothetical protein
VRFVLGKINVLLSLKVIILHANCRLELPDAEEVQAQAMTIASGRVSFTVNSVDCIVYMPIFQRKLVNLKRIKSVKPLPMLNKIVIEFSPADVSEVEVKKEVRDSDLVMGRKIL